MKIMRRNCAVLLALSVLSLCAGCATGPQFSPSAHVGPPPGKALIYLYRMPQLACSACTENIKVNGNYVGNLKNGSYFTYIATPGRLDFTGKLGPGFNTLMTALSVEDKLMSLNVEAGKTYFIRFAYYQNIFCLKMDLIREEAGKAELSNCRLSE